MRDKIIVAERDLKFLLGNENQRGLAKQGSNILNEHTFM